MLIQRPAYLSQLLSYKDMDVVKIVTGVRRAGKSTLFDLYIAELLKMGISREQIQVYKLEELENEPLLEYHKLHGHITARLVPDKKNYVFLDEIQIVSGFGKVVNSLFIKGVDLYLTGSNSKMLSSDIANQIERQKITIQMFPLSFKEYICGYPFNHTRDEQFENYIKFSSFPKALQISESNNGFDAKQTSNQIQNYLGDIYDKIVLRDIVENKKIVNLGQLKSVFQFMADNIGREISIKNMADAMNKDGRGIDGRALEKYIDAFLDSFMLYKAGRYDIRGKELLKTRQKYYMVDMGLRYFILGNKNIDSGRTLENVAYLELLRRGYSVNIGKIDNNEVDFIARKDDVVEYYQISDTARAENTLARELAPFAKLKDNYPKYLLTRDYETNNHNGVRQINVLKWLANQ